MQKSSAILTCVLFFGGIGSTEANPLDSPDIIYIDGQPCNGACQAYMAWSRQTMPVSGQPQRPSPSATTGQRSPKAPTNRAIKVHEAGSKLATPARVTKQSALTQQQLTAAMADRKESKQKTNSTDRSEAGLPGDSEPTEPALSDHTDPRIAIVMARPEIRSVADLAGKNVAIEDKQSASGGDIRIAITAAGATGVQLAESPAKALDRVIDGEVPAAVLMLAYPEAAETFPEIAGFNIFRIPLTPAPSRVTRRDLSPTANATAASDSATTKSPDLRPTGAIAADFHTRTTQEVATAAMAVAERMTTAAVDPQGIAPAPSNDADRRIAILMARPEIKSLSDLAGKKIAIDDKQSSSSSNVRRAIAAVAEVQVSEGQTKAIDRLIGGEVSAAVLTLVSQEAAEAFPEIAGFNIFRIPLTSEMPRAKIADLQPAIKAAAASDTAGGKNTAVRPGGPAADDFHTPTVQDLVTAATAVAERMTTAMAHSKGPEQKTNGADRSDRSATAGEAERITPPPSGDSDPRIVILMARQEIKSVSDLAGREIAIDDKLSASSGKLRNVIAAAGAAEVKVSEGQAINRLILAEVPAAVLTLVSSEAAEAFPEVAGFRIFRIPLSPGSVLIRHP